MKKDNERFRILIVDDVPKNIQVAANILQRQGYHMAFAQNGKTALSQIRANDFDLVLLDIMMPEMDGFEVCMEMKNDPETKDIPIIFLTAKTDTDSIVKAFELGAMDYVTKPFNGAELLSRVKTHLELNHTRRKLVEANASKDKFFSIIAHDLKNPFNAMIGLSRMLLTRFDKIDEARKQEYIKTIYDSSKNTYQLLENLLDWSRMQTGRIDFRPMKIGLAALAHENVSLLKSAAENKNIELSSDVNADSTAFADHNMATMVLRNLLSNAIKFTHDGGEVNVSSETDGEYEKVTVTDTGVGIPPDEIPKLFRLEVHHSTPGTAKEQGTGLGLILCKEFIEKNGGEIRVESDIGKGSRFVFTLPKTESVIG